MCCGIGAPLRAVVIAGKSQTCRASDPNEVPERISFGAGGIYEIDTCSEG